MPSWAFMWMISFGIYGLLKVLGWYFRDTSAPIWKHLAYLLAWPGMDVGAFFFEQNDTSPFRSEWLFAGIKLMLGVILVGVTTPARDRFGDAIAGWMGMIGIVFMLHFGLFHLLSCLWCSDARHSMFSDISWSLRDLSDPSVSGIQGILNMKIELATAIFVAGIGQF